MRTVKAFFLCSFSAVVALPLHAQRYSTSKLSAPAKTITTDSVVTVLPPAPTKPIAAAIAKPALEAKPGVKAVPLAGHKAYFGPMNDYVNGFVRTYLSAHQKTLSVVKTRSIKRFTLIDGILQKHGIPKELKYLAVIESALNNTAVSPVGAVGPWQFMEGTAQNMGLTVNGSRDDRTDWYKSTHAAAKYLKLLYSQLGDWLLVVAAYNSGPVPVVRAMQRTGSRNFWDIKKYLPRETQGHVLAFVATASIFEKLQNYIAVGQVPHDFKFSPDDAPAVADVKVPAKPQFTKEELERMAIVRIAEPIVLDFMADEMLMDKKELHLWNPDYDLFLFSTYSEPFYKLRIPKSKLDAFIEKKEYLTKRSRQIFADAEA